jgi:hypothetical protein
MTSVSTGESGILLPFRALSYLSYWLRQVVSRGGFSKAALTAAFYFRFGQL